MTYTLDITINGLPKLITNGQKGSWRSAWAESRKWHRIVEEQIVLQRLRPDAPLKTARLVLTRYSSSEPDTDNLIAGFKGVIDALVRSKVIENDRRENIGRPGVFWEYAPRNKGKIRIQLWEECA